MGRDSTRFPGVYKRVSKRRRHQGKPDVCFDITYKDLRGKKVWEKVGYLSEGYTAAKASQIRAERLQKQRHGDLMATRKNITFGEAWDMFDQRHIATLADPDSERMRYETHLKDKLAHLRLDRIGTLDVEDLKADLLVKLAPSTAKKVIGLVGSLYRKMSEWDVWHGRSPTRGIKFPKADVQRVRFLTNGEARQLMEGLRLRSDQVWRMAMVSLHTGFRASEIFRLRGEHIDLEAAMIRAEDTKNGESRTVHMTPTLMNEVFGTMPTTPMGHLVFPSRTGKQITAISDTYERTVEALKLNKGIDDNRYKVVFHTLRHTFASWLASDGIPLYVISQLLGHKSLSQTQRYAHLCPDVRQQAVSYIDKRFTNS